MVVRQGGFTLVEVMVTIALLGILALVAAPYTIAWVDEARVGEARAQLSRAYSHAKSIALRNPNEVTGNEVAASVTLSGDDILVCAGEPTCNENGAAWQGGWPTGVTLAIAIGNTPLEDIRINNRGQVLDDSDNPINRGLTLTFSKGSVTRIFPDENNESD